MQYVLYVKSVAEAPFVGAEDKSEVFEVKVNVESLALYIATFDNDGEHRASSEQNSYGTNSYHVGNVTWSLNYADCTTTGKPLSGDAHIIARVAKNTKNSPSAITSNILSEQKTITKITFLSELKSGVSLSVYYSIDNGINWNEINYAKDADIHETYGYSANIDNVQSSNFELKFEWSVSSSTKSNRDNKLDDVRIYGL